LISQFQLQNQQIIIAAIRKQGVRLMVVRRAVKQIIEPMRR